MGPNLMTDIIIRRGNMDAGREGGPCEDTGRSQPSPCQGERPQRTPTMPTP